MIDIMEIQDGKDIKLQDTIVTKASNVLSIQLGALEYSPNFGVDFKFFLQSELQFQNDSFKSYLVQRLVENQVNVGEVIHKIEALIHRYTFSVGDNSTSSGSLIV